MTVIKYDVGDVEEFTPYAGPTPRRGVYDGFIRQAEYGQSQAGNNKFRFVVIIDSKKKDHKQFNGCPLFQDVTIGDLSEDWMKRNLKMITKVFGLKEKGQLNTDAIIKKAEAGGGMRVRVIVKNETYNDDLQAKANGLLPAKGDDEEPEDGVEVDETDEVAEDADEADEAEGDEDEADEDEGPDLSALNRTQLKALIKEEALEVRVTKGKSDEDLRAEIQEALDAKAEESGDEEDEDEAEGDEDEGSVEDEIAELDRTGLKAYIKDNSLEVRVTKGMSDDDIRAAIIAAWPDEDEEGDDSEPPF